MQVRSVVAIFLLECLDPSEDETYCYDDPREAVSFAVEREVTVTPSASWRLPPDEAPLRRPGELAEERRFSERFDALVRDRDFALQHVMAESFTTRVTLLTIPRPREAGVFELASLGASLCENHDGERTCRVAEGTLDVRRDDDGGVDVTVDVRAEASQTDGVQMDARVQITRRTWTERRCFSRSTAGGCGCGAWGDGMSGAM